MPAFSGSKTSTSKKRKMESKNTRKNLYPVDVNTTMDEEISHLGNLGFSFSEGNKIFLNSQSQLKRPRSAPTTSASNQPKPTTMSNRQTKIREHQRKASTSFYNIREILFQNYGLPQNVQDVKQTPNYKILQIIENVLNDKIDKNKKTENESYNRIRDLLVKKYDHNKDVKDYATMPNYKLLNLIETALNGTKNSMNKDKELDDCYTDNKLLIKELEYFKKMQEFNDQLSKMHPTNLQQSYKQLDLINKKFFEDNRRLFHENTLLKQMGIQAGILHPRTTFRSIGMNGTTTPIPSHSSTSR